MVDHPAGSCGGPDRWWRARAHQEATGYLHSLWRDRRRIFLGPFVVFSLAVLAGAAAVLVMLRDVASHGGLSILGLSLAIQAILIPLRFGVFFPEADVQTQYGMHAHDSILEIERSAAAGAGQLRPAGTAPGSSGPERRLPSRLQKIINYE
jgi:ATP-binding cassette subfamily B protein